MAINIKEILHPNDSDSIKFEKINYNFDQILINGGGPQGIQGTKGLQGADGLTGIKGQKGEIGLTGPQGNAGTSDTQWAAVANTNNDGGAADSSILKPKIGANDIGSSIWLGDANFDEGVPTDGIIDANARINVQRTVGTYDHFISYITSDTDRINFTYETLNTIPTYGYKKDSSAIGTVLGYQIRTDNITINADTNLKLSAGTMALDLDNTNNLITIYETGTPGLGTLEIEMNSTFANPSIWTTTKSIKLPAGVVGDRPIPAESGMIRYNTTSNQFEGYYSNSWKAIGGVIDNDLDTYITAETNDNDEDILRFNVGEDPVIGGIQVASMGETIIEGVNTFTNVSSFNTKIEAKDDILINDFGSGIIFKSENNPAPSGDAEAPNDGSALYQRRMDDYFYQPQETSDAGLSIGTVAPFADHSITLFSQWKISNNTFRLHRQADSTGVQQTPAQQLRMLIRSSNCKVGYVKTGHLVNVWGQIEFFPAAVNTNEPEFSSGVNVNGNPSSNAFEQAAHKAQRVAIFPSAPSDAEIAGTAAGNGGYFPYTSSLDEWTYFPISIKIEGWDQLDVDPPVNKYDYWGAIPPGGNYFNIARIEATSIQIADTAIEVAEIGTPSVANKIQANFMNASDFKWDVDDFGYAIILNYSFSMPTDDKSYEMFTYADKIATYTEFTPMTIVDPGEPGEGLGGI